MMAAGRSSSSRCRLQSERRAMDGKPEIHIIDDDAAMRESLAFLLDVNGYRPVLHESANSFLEEVSSEGSNCAISDIRMPGMNGIELVRRLRSQGSPCQV